MLRIVPAKQLAPQQILVIGENLEKTGKKINKESIAYHQEAITINILMYFIWHSSVLAWKIHGQRILEDHSPGDHTEPVND